jgi:hypothetical protein
MQAPNYRYAAACRAIGEWIASFGKRLLTGNGLSSTPAPITIFEPRSNLQKITDCWMYMPLLLQAASAPNSLTRLKLATAWYVAGLQHNFDTWRKPFNPVLGETWQSTNACGCEAFLEQVSHHPPIAAYTVKGSSFHMHGSVELQIQVWHLAVWIWCSRVPSESLLRCIP